ncbi:hypothetical protein M1I95_04425 [Rossellomorea marisflavi]|uniref:hypothetical protein n=1 Tax=Rossellomorea marisflavi TaxID=189381 RepID=UPI0027A39DEC|nr:hypothetical protein [Rossellomorea marisflavi]UTE73767.1 hypothetical protein M1I95_04425 [Rossellomorea marisflavi]
MGLTKRLKDHSNNRLIIADMNGIKKDDACIKQESSSSRNLGASFIHGPVPH